jgi:uncharacterized protein YlxW (UPF0749 family)
MDELGNKLIEQAGPVGAALGVVILAAGAVVARAKGWLGLGSPPKANAHTSEASGDVMTELRSINARLGKFDERINELEHDLASRPTRQDMHRLEMSLARMDERMSALTSNVKATGEGVLRIENYLLDLSRKAK